MMALGPTLAKSTILAIVGFAVAIAAELSTGQMFGLVVALELAQMPLLFHLQGRVSSVETDIEHLKDHNHG